MDPSLVSVIGLAKDAGGKSSEEVSTTPGGGKAKKIDKNSGSVTKTPVSSSKKTETKEKKHHSSPTKTAKLTTDNKLEAMDLKWSERFSRLAAMLLSKTLSQPEPSFQPVKITPVKPPPAGAVDNTEPFFAPVKSTDRPNSAQPASAPPTATGRPSSTEQVPADPATKPTASVSGLGVSH